MERKADIMIVDDTPENLKLLSLLLREQGHRVRALPSGKMALAAMRNQRPEILLLDITMPEMDGVECITKLLQMMPKTNILVVSALTDKATAIAALRQGARGFVNKPFSDDELRMALLELMDAT